MSSNSELLTLMQGLSAKRDMQLVLIALKFIGDDHVGDSNHAIHNAGMEYLDLAQRIENAMDEVADEQSAH